MSGSYHTEEEQVEALKKWWKENGKSTVVSIVVAVAAVFGWQAWQKQQQAKAEAASRLYQNMVTAAYGAGGQPDEKQVTTAVHLANTLKSDYPDTAYAQFAALYKARFDVRGDDLDQAREELQWVLDRATVAEIKIQARLRLARVLYAQAQYDDALALLNGDSRGYAAGFEEVRGDIYRAQGKTQEALAAYRKAMEINSGNEVPINNPLLQIKLQQLQSALGKDPVEAADA